MRKTTVLVADDHAIVKEGLVSLLKEHGFDVVAAVGDGHELLATAKRIRPDAIVTDLSMPGLSGIDVLHRLRSSGIDSKVIVLTMHHDADMAARALRAGASAFLLKLSAGDELLTAAPGVGRPDVPDAGTDERSARADDRLRWRVRADADPATA